MVNFYRDIWPRRSQYILLAPLNKLAGMQSNKDIGTTGLADTEQTAFIHICWRKKPSLHFQTLQNHFMHVYTDASDQQLGVRVVHDGGGKPIVVSTKENWISCTLKNCTMGEIYNYWDLKVFAEDRIRLSVYRSSEPTIQQVPHPKHDPVETDVRGVQSQGTSCGPRKIDFDGVVLVNSKLSSCGTVH